jgi:hypothetical protein
MTNVGSTHSSCPVFHITVSHPVAWTAGTDCYEAEHGFGVPPLLKV